MEKTSMEIGDVVLTNANGIKPCDAVIKGMWEDKHGMVYDVLLTGGIRLSVRSHEIISRRERNNGL